MLGDLRADKVLNLFDKFAARGAHLSPQEGECISSSSGASKMCTSATIEGSHMTLTEINKTDAIAKVRILVEQVILRHLKTFLMKWSFHFASHVDDILVVCRCI